MGGKEAWGGLRAGQAYSLVTIEEEHVVRRRRDAFHGQNFIQVALNLGRVPAVCTVKQLQLRLRFRVLQLRSLTRKQVPQLLLGEVPAR